MIDLLDLPFNVIHELYRSSFLTAQAQKEKEEKEQKEREKEEAEARRRERADARNANRRGPINSPIPVKQPNVQMATQQDPDQRAAQNRLGDAQMSEVEEFFEEGL